MNFRALLVCVSLLFVSLTALPARADDQLVPIAQAGDWIAMEHTDSIIGAPDMCMAFEPSDRFAVRSDEDDVEFRLSDESWSLPANVSGTLEIDVNGNKYPFSITANTSSMVAATVSDAQLLSVVADMNKAGSMSVIAGSAAPIDVSLNGSNTVLTAFLTCANIQAPNLGGGTNPFSTSPANQ